MYIHAYLCIGRPFNMYLHVPAFNMYLGMYWEELQLQGRTGQDWLVCKGSLPGRGTYM